MDKFWEFLKKNWIAVVGCVFAVLFSIVGIPLLINWAYSIPAWCDFFAVDWEAKDALSYYGDALGFIGTVIFSGLALWQNHKIQKANDTHTQLLEQMERDKNAPCIVATSPIVAGAEAKIRFTLKNISENIAQDITVSNVRMLDADGSEKWRSDKVSTKDFMPIEAEYRISMDNPPFNKHGMTIFCDVVYHDMFGEQHKGQVVFTLVAPRGVPTVKFIKEKTNKGKH